MSWLKHLMQIKPQWSMPIERSPPLPEELRPTSCGPGYPLQKVIRAHVTTEHTLGRSSRVRDYAGWQC